RPACVPRLSRSDGSIPVYPRSYLDEEIRMNRRAYASLMLAVAILNARSAYAHHEAMFGPQSSAVLSPGIFLSALVFDKETGKNDQQRRETTTVYGVGFKPLKRHPLSVAFVLPVTFASGAPDPSQPGAATRGFEDTVLSARYRVDAGRFASSL